MCRRRSEGTSYTKCGHYVQTKWTAKLDCNNPRCTKSTMHPPYCRGYDCDRNCEKYYLPDDRETITAYVDDWCHLCMPWYGPNARRRV